MHKPGDNQLDYSQIASMRAVQSSRTTCMMASRSMVDAQNPAHDEVEKFLHLSLGIRVQAGFVSLHGAYSTAQDSS
ncbi:MAG: hypothetical protein IMY80_08660 [Chloroflexi bacterium]|nr:hypothetical protein [Chloroflexota bacterium]